MATTRIIAMHRNKGCTAEQTLKARLDYIKNPEKTRDGELSRSKKSFSENGTSEDTFGAGIAGCL